MLEFTKNAVAIGRQIILGKHKNKYAIVTKLPRGVDLVVTDELPEDVTGKAVFERTPTITSISIAEVGKMLDEAFMTEPEVNEANVIDILLMEKEDVHNGDEIIDYVFPEEKVKLTEIYDTEDTGAYFGFMNDVKDALDEADFRMSEMVNNAIKYEKPKKEDLK